MATERDGNPHSHTERAKARDADGAASATAPVTERGSRSGPDRSPLLAHFWEHPVTRVALRIGPVVAGAGVWTWLMDYLPQPLNPNVGRYGIATACALATMTTLAWARLWYRGRSSRNADETGDGLASAPAGPSTSVEKLFHSAREGLLAGMVTAETDAGALVGWHHFFDLDQHADRPTAVGTSYGLKAMLLLDMPDARFQQHRVVQTLWRLQKPGGGWSARTQSTLPRPEVTAWVLVALLQAGANEDKVADATQRFLETLDAMTDPVGRQRTHVVTTVLAALARLAPSAPSAARLRDLLLSGSVRAPEQGLRCWGERLVAGGGADRVVPSMSHTARAIVALQRFGRLDRAAASAVDGAARWLAICGDLSNQTEHIRRRLPDHRMESLVVKHFTAAWVARALMSIDKDNMPEHDDLLHAAIERVYQFQSDGVWEWDNRERPVWMTYQGIATLRLQALRNSRLPA
jgi:hypothetical protein